MAEILAAIGGSVEATLRPQVQPVPWQAAMKRSIRDGAELCRRLKIPHEVAFPAAETDFSIFAPLEYVARMQSGDAADPLLRQVLGIAEEVRVADQGRSDPVDDLSAQRAPGLLQKYDRRVLMIVTGACAVHCRYCFRRHFPYASAPKGREGWQQSLNIIAGDHSLDEVILSGGDPLTLSDTSLAWLVEQIGRIGHIRRLRIHSRVPVVIPQRICPELLKWVERSSLALYFVLHFNHAAEVDSAVDQALLHLRRAGATLLNQAVLLRGVNDSFKVQHDLCLQLINRQVLPYYLHQLDPVRGGMHFQVRDAEAISIANQLREHLPGYAVPNLVRELAGQPSKTLIELRHESAQPTAHG